MLAPIRFSQIVLQTLKEHLKANILTFLFSTEPFFAQVVPHQRPRCHYFRVLMPLVLPNLVRLHGRDLHLQNPTAPHRFPPKQLVFLRQSGTELKGVQYTTETRSTQLGT